MGQCYSVFAIYMTQISMNKVFLRENLGEKKITILFGQCHIENSLINKVQWLQNAENLKLSVLPLEPLY